MSTSRRPSRPPPAPLLNHSYITFIGHWRGQLCILIVVLVVGLIYFIVREPIEAWRRRRRERVSAAVRGELLASEAKAQSQSQSQMRDQQLKERDGEVDSTGVSSALTVEGQGRERKRDGKRRKGSMLRVDGTGNGIGGGSGNGSGLSASSSPGLQPIPDSPSALVAAQGSTRKATLSPSTSSRPRKASSSTPPPNSGASLTTPKSGNKKNRSQSSSRPSIVTSNSSSPSTSATPSLPSVNLSSSFDGFTPCTPASAPRIRVREPTTENRSPVRVPSPLKNAIELATGSSAFSADREGLRAAINDFADSPTPEIGARIPLPPSPMTSSVLLDAGTEGSSQANIGGDLVDSHSDRALSMSPSMDSRSDISAGASAFGSGRSATGEKAGQGKKKDEGFSIYPDEGWLPPSVMAGVNTGGSGKKKKKGKGGGGGAGGGSSNASAQSGSGGASRGDVPAPLDLSRSNPANGGDVVPAMGVGSPITPRRHSRKTSLGFRMGTVEEQVKERDEIIDALRAEVGLAKAEEAKARREMQDMKERNAGSAGAGNEIAKEGKGRRGDKERKEREEGLQQQLAIAHAHLAQQQARIQVLEQMYSSSPQAHQGIPDGQNQQQGQSNLPRPPPSLPSTPMTAPSGPFASPAPLNTRGGITPLLPMGYPSPFNMSPLPHGSHPHASPNPMLYPQSHFHPQVQVHSMLHPLHQQALAMHQQQQQQQGQGGVPPHMVPLPHTPMMQLTPHLGMGGPMSPLPAQVQGQGHPHGPLSPSPFRRTSSAGHGHSHGIVHPHPHSQGHGLGHGHPHGYSPNRSESHGHGRERERGSERDDVITDHPLAGPLTPGSHYPTRSEVDIGALGYTDTGIGRPPGEGEDADQQRRASVESSVLKKKKAEAEEMALKEGETTIEEEGDVEDKGDAQDSGGLVSSEEQEQGGQGLGVGALGDVGSTFAGLRGNGQAHDGSSTMMLEPEASVSASASTTSSHPTSPRSRQVLVTPGMISEELQADGHHVGLEVITTDSEADHADAGPNGHVVPDDSHKDSKSQPEQDQNRAANDTGHSNGETEGAHFLPTSYQNGHAYSNGFHPHSLSHSPSPGPHDHVHPHINESYMYSPYPPQMYTSSPAPGPADPSLLGVGYGSPYISSRSPSPGPSSLPMQLSSSGTGSANGQVAGEASHTGLNPNQNVVDLNAIVKNAQKRADTASASAMLPLQDYTPTFASLAHTPEQIMEIERMKQEAVRRARERSVLGAKVDTREDAGHAQAQAQAQGVQDGEQLDHNGVDTGHAVGASEVQA